MADFTTTLPTKRLATSYPKLGQRLQFAAQAKQENRIIYLEDKQESPVKPGT